MPEGRYVPNGSRPRVWVGFINVEFRTLDQKSSRSSELFKHFSMESLILAQDERWRRA